MVFKKKKKKTGLFDKDYTNKQSDNSQNKTILSAVDDYLAQDQSRSKTIDRFYLTYTSNRIERIGL